MTPTRAECERRDRDDPLASLRDQFVLPPGIIYLDGNSLGPPPRSTAPAIQQVITEQWGTDLIGGWNRHDWLTLPIRLGDLLAPLIGVGPGEILVADSTSVNLYKVLTVALQSARARDPQRTVVVSESENFPSDLYIAESVASACGCTLQLSATGGDPLAALDEHTAVLLLTQVDYRTGRLHDMAAATAAAHARGALVVWDLAHTAGALPIDLTRDDADFAVGCGYKFLNGGPGAPGFLWVNPRRAHPAMQPVRGWFGHAAPFEFAVEYRPASGIAGYQSGTPPVLSMVALEHGIRSVLAADALGGLAALRGKSIALTDLFIELVSPLEATHGVRVVSPLDGRQRGSQVSLTHPEDAYAVVQALIDRGVIGDFRAPDIARFGFAPLYTSYVDVYDAAAHLTEVLRTEAWRASQYAVRAAVT